MDSAYHHLLRRGKMKNHHPGAENRCPFSFSMRFRYQPTFSHHIFNVSVEAPRRAVKGLEKPDATGVV
jgi:hypothetical protein